MSKTNPDLRAKIDAIDDELVTLLNRRSSLVTEVGAIKKATLPEGASFIRPGREAEMVRNITGRFQDAPFPATAAAQLWRLIISASLSLEAPLTVSAFAGDGAQDNYWLAREYFGCVTPVLRETTARRVLGDVIDGKAQVGVLPLPDASAEGKWWQKLVEPLRIFACVPFLLPKGGEVRALAVARVEPEETGNDITYFSIETQIDVSQSRIRAAIDSHKLEAHWLATDTFASGNRLHLIEIQGFVTLAHPFVAEIRAVIGNALVAVNWLGAYALPITL